MSSQQQTSASLAYDQTVDLALPDTVAFLPEAAPGPRVADVSDAPMEVAYAAVPVSAVAEAAKRSAEPATSEAAQPAVLAPSPVPQPAASSAEATQVAYVVPDKPVGDLDGLIDKYAAIYEVPVALVRRVVKRESNFNPAAYNRGHWGLMQIKHATARGMGYGGPAKGLLDAETNLKYAVKYLRGAFMVADGNHDRADKLYQRGYYYDAKRKGLLSETGLGRDRVSRKRAAASQPGA